MLVFGHNSRVKLVGDQEPNKVLIINLKLRPSAFEYLQRFSKTVTDLHVLNDLN